MNYLMCEKHSLVSHKSHIQLEIIEQDVEQHVVAAKQKVHT